MPGSVEWADFDPTATANAVTLLGALAFLPPRRARAHVRRVPGGLSAPPPRRGRLERATPPYEIRIAGALIRLGDRAAANELLEFFVADRRPPSWNQWPEIAWRDPKAPGHVGDMPHAWVGAEYVIAFRTMLAYEDVDDDALVVGAGVPEAWLDGGVVVRGLPTYFGTLDLTLRRLRAGLLSCRLAGGLRVPGGRIVLRPPLPRPIAGAEVDGRAAAFDAETVTVDRSPATVLVTY